MKNEVKTMNGKSIKIFTKEAQEKMNMRKCDLKGKLPE